MSTDTSDVPQPPATENAAVANESESPGPEIVETTKTAEPAEPQDAPSIEEPEPEKHKPKPKLCGICDKEQGKYKCPRCGLP